MAAEKTIQDAVDDELEQYGVWVKVEPVEIPVETESGAEYDLEDLKNIEPENETLLTEEEENLLGSLEDSAESLNEKQDEDFPVDEGLDFPEEESLDLPPLEEDSITEASLDFDEQAASSTEISTEQGEDMDQFNDVEAFEQDLHETFDSSSPEAEEEPAGDAVASNILLKIEKELSSIKEELSALKKELSSLRPGAPAPSEAEEEAAAKTGFFEEDEDETIALTGDELDNILNTADITEEAGQGTESPEEIIVDEALKMPEAADESETMSFEEEPAAGEELDIQMPQMTDEESAELSFEPESEAGEINLGDTEDIIPLEEKAEETGELNAEIELPEEEEFSLDLPEEEHEEVLDEIEIDIPEESPVEIASPSAETEVDLQTESLATEELATEEFDTETIDVTAEDVAEEELVLETPEAVENKAEEEEIEIFDEDLNIDLEDIDLSEIESEENLSAEELPEIEELSMDEIEKTANGGTTSEEVPAEEFTLDEEPAETVEGEDEFPEITLEEEEIADMPKEEEETVVESFEEPELSSEPLELMPEEIEEELPEPEAVAVTVEESGDIGLEEEGDISGIPAPLKEEIRSVLSYMDQLLDALPEEKIQEFAKSEHFEVYKKLFDELGLH